MRLNTLNAKFFGHEDNAQEKKDQSLVSVSEKKIIQNVIDTLLQSDSDLIVEVDGKDRSRNDLKNKVMELIPNMTYPEKEKIYTKILDHLYGYGPLQDLVMDDEISDIDFPTFNCGIIKRNGRKEFLPKEYLFPSEADMNRFVKTIVVRHGGVINESSAHDRVADDEHRLRINVSIPPRNLKHSSLNIRCHNLSRSLDDLEGVMLTKEQREKVEAMIKEGKKFLIVGKGGSGKTTLLRAMLKEAPKEKVYLVMEKDAELFLENPQFIQQRIKKSALGGVEVKLVDLVKDGLTMSLDGGYIVGEIVGDEAWHIINAGITDHMVCGTIHANSAEATHLRLLSLIQTYQPHIEDKVILELIKESFDYFIYLKDFKLEEIYEVPKRGGVHG